MATPKDILAEIAAALSRYLDVDAEVDAFTFLSGAPLNSLRAAISALPGELPEQCEPFVAAAEAYAVNRVKEADAKALGMNVHQVAAIHLYTQESPLYRAVNAVLRARDRTDAKPFFLFIRLLLSALHLLPLERATVWRGVGKDLLPTYGAQQGKLIAWWGFSSCTRTQKETETFLGAAAERTLFSVECHSCVSIRAFSAIPTQDEVLIFPGTQFEVVAASGKTRIVHLRESTLPHLIDFPHPQLPAAVAALNQTPPVGAAGSVLHSAVDVADVKDVKLTFARSIGKKASGSKGDFSDVEALCMSEDKTLLYVSDAQSHRVHAFRVSDGKLDHRFGGGAGAGRSGKGSKEGELNEPRDVAISRALVYVTDAANHRVQVFKAAAAGGVQQPAGLFVRAFGKQGKADGEFNQPTGICISLGHIFVSELGNHRVQVFRETDGVFLRSFGKHGSAEGEFHQPHGMAASNSLLYICDSKNHRVQVFRVSDSAFVRSFGKQGSGDGELSYPERVAVRDGCIFVSELGNARISVFRESDGAFLRVFGQIGGARSSKDKDAAVDSPGGLTIADGHLFVAAQRTCRIDVFKIFVVQ